MGNIPNNLHLPPFCDLNETTQLIKVANKFCCFVSVSCMMCLTVFLDKGLRTEPHQLINSAGNNFAETLL